MEPHLRNWYVERVRRGTDEGRALDPACYRDPAFFELELEHVLRPAWHAVARWDALPEPGDYMAIDLFGEPLAVVRDGSGQLRVFSNVCRHRAHTVVAGTGNAKSLVCPYHNWTYGLDGKLRGAPLMTGEEGFDRAHCALPEVAAEIWQGFLMVSLSSEPRPAAEGLAGLDKRIESIGLAEMVSIGVLDFDSPWNWKVMVDNFMESYHHLGIHSGTLQKTNPAKDTYCADADGSFSLLENPGIDAKASFLVIQVFPTLLLSMVEQGPIGIWYEMQIDGHEHFHLRIHALAPPDLAKVEDVGRVMIDTLMKVHLEDIPACEAVQRGLASRLWQPGALSVREACLGRFHRHLAEQLGG